MKPYKKIRQEALEYGAELDSAFLDLKKACASTNGFSRNLSDSVVEIREIFDRMDRDERIPGDVTDFYRRIYKTIIEEER